MKRNYGWEMTKRNEIKENARMQKYDEIKCFKYGVKGQKTDKCRKEGCLLQTLQSRTYEY